MKMIRGFLISTAEILLCLYAVIQHIVRKSTLVSFLLKYNGINIILATLCACLSVVGLVLLVILLVPLAAYKKTVDVILKVKYKELYGGLLEGIDEMWALETKESRHIINCLLFVDFGSTPETDIMQRVKEIYSEKVVYQFTSIRQRYLGYYFRLQNQVGVEDLIKELDLSEGERSNKHLFERALGELSNSPMPKDDVASFELHVGTKPVQFSAGGQQGAKKLYPLLMRIHHTVGDGISLLSFLLKNLADEEISVEQEMIDKVKLVETYKNELVSEDFDYSIEVISKRLRNYAAKACQMLKQIANVNVYHFAPTTPADSNILRGPKLCGEKILAYYIEESPEYIAKVKSIKKRIPGSTFTDVVMTAVSASFWEYFKQNSDHIPDQLFLSFIIRPIEKNLEYIVSEKTGQKEVKLGNKFSLGILGLPVNVAVKNPSTALRERLIEIKNESEKLKNSVDILVYYWQLRFFTNLLPAPVLNLLVGWNQTPTITFSNLPGIRGIHIQTYKLQDILFWIPNVGDLGVGLSILTYDGRFQMGLVADKALISSGDKAQNILDNITKYIDLLNDELNNVN